MGTESEPRRFKLDSELDAEERAAAHRPGGDGRRAERAEYVAWRGRNLKHEDLGLRRRLLEEEAESLRQRAAERDTAALERLSPDDWHARAEAKQRGEEPVPLPVAARSQQQRATAAELDTEAGEIAQHLAEIPTAGELADRKGAHR